MKKNYTNEPIPNITELVNNANSILESLLKIKPVKINGSLVKNDSYVGRKYFEEQQKNSYSYKSVNENDFSGVYVFYKNNKPIYVGISGTIIRRLKYHLFGLKNNESSLVYLIAKENYQKEYGIKYSGKRSDFPFSNFRQEIQTEMINNWSFKIYPIKNGYNLSFTEIYLACALETKWNTFKTH